MDCEEGANAAVAISITKCGALVHFMLHQNRVPLRNEQELSKKPNMTLSIKSITNSLLSQTSILTLESQ